MDQKKLLALLAGSALISVSSHAQVFKCAGPNGKTVYTDAPCGKRVDDAALQSNTIDAGPRLRDLPRESRPSAPHAERTAPRGVCPTPLEVRNIETAASSTRYLPGTPEHWFMKDEVARAAGCNPAVTSYTARDWVQIRDYHDYQNRMDERDRERARQEALRIHARRAVPAR